MSESNLPRKRVTNAERDRAASLLHDAFADGQITITEFDERSRALYAATFSDELPTLIDDLSPVEHPTAPTSAEDPVTGERGGSAFSLAMMGGSERTGQWLIAPTHTTLTVMGGTVLDLREARLASETTVINALAVMGGVDIIVPENVRVVNSGIGIMGGFGTEDHPSCAVSQADVPADAPVVHVRGLSLMGGVGVIRAAHGAPVE